MIFEQKLIFNTSSNISLSLFFFLSHHSSITFFIHPFYSYLSNCLLAECLSIRLNFMFGINNPPHRYFSLYTIKKIKSEIKKNMKFISNSISKLNNEIIRCEIFLSLIFVIKLIFPLIM